MSSADDERTLVVIELFSRCMVQDSRATISEGSSIACSSHTRQTPGAFVKGISFVDLPLYQICYGSLCVPRHAGSTSMLSVKRYKFLERPADCGY